MFFTQDDFKKIEEYLKSKSIKDTQFDAVTEDLSGNETIVLVQNGQNRRMSVKDIVTRLFGLGVSDFLNIPDKYGSSYTSIDEAIRLIPANARKLGQVITFLDENGHWRIYQFTGEALNQWTNLTLWIDILEFGRLFFPDEEDITSNTVDGLNLLSFKDKEYDPDIYSGLGRIYLRKNIVEGKNILTQEAISIPNTIYIIQYDYDLDGKYITLPENCTLLFEGGSFKNGVVRLNGARILPMSMPEYISAIGQNPKAGQIIYQEKVLGYFDGTDYRNTDGTLVEKVTLI